MPAESPAVLLRRAATRLDELAAPLAEHGRWEAETAELDDEWVIATDPPFCGGATIDGQWTAAEDLREPVARWAALLGPQVAGPLAAWLRDGAARCADSISRWEAGPQWQGPGDDDLPTPMTPDRIVAAVEHHFRHEVAVARALLGETEPRDAR